MFPSLKHWQSPRSRTTVPGYTKSVLLSLDNPYGENDVMKKKLIQTLCLTVAAMIPAAYAGDGDKDADMTKPVKVFIMMGQSNMLQYGTLGNPDGSEPKTG